VRSKWAEFGGAFATLIALGVIAPILYFRWYIIFGVSGFTILFYNIFGA